MVKKRIITIAGKPGSGKSTAAKAVAAKLGFDHLSGGDLYRAFAKDRGLDILQATKANEVSGEIDHLVDAKLEDINTTGDGVVIDSRTAWFFIPNSFKVFLDLNSRKAAERILASMDETRRKSEHIPADPVKYAESLDLRLASDLRRYRNLYDINPFDTSHYELVINTDENTIDQTVEKIHAAFQDWLST